MIENLIFRETIYNIGLKKCLVNIMSQIIIYNCIVFYSVNYQ